MRASGNMRSAVETHTRFHLTKRWLFQAVEALIAANEQAGSFIEKPALEVEARSLAKGQSDSGAESMDGKTIGHYRLNSARLRRYGRGLPGTRHRPRSQRGAQTAAR